MNQFKQLIEIVNANNFQIMQLEMELALLENKAFKHSLYSMTRFIYESSTKESKEMTFHLQQIAIADAKVIKQLNKEIEKLRKQ
jgi:hypothetical protein